MCLSFINIVLATLVIFIDKNTETQRSIQNRAQGHVHCTDAIRSLAVMCLPNSVSETFPKGKSIARLSPGSSTMANYLAHKVVCLSSFIDGDN